MPLNCPNCSAVISRVPARCDRCGYRPELAIEYLWIYGGGCAVILLGLVIGALGIATEGVGPNHWSRIFHGWYPFAPWPRDYNWIGFLGLGIAFTGCGLGITRQKRPAFFALATLSLYLTCLSALASLGVLANLHSRAPAFIMLGLDGVLLGFIFRLGLAFLRAPARNFSIRQEPQEHPESAA